MTLYRWYYICLTMVLLCVSCNTETSLGGPSKGIFVSIHDESPKCRAYIRVCGVEVYPGDNVFINEEQSQEIHYWFPSGCYQWVDSNGDYEIQVCEGFDGRINLRESELVRLLLHHCES